MQGEGLKGVNGSKREFVEASRGEPLLVGKGRAHMLSPRAKECRPMP